MDGGLIGGIVSIAVAIVGGPHAWRALREWLRSRAAAREAERTALEAAEQRHLTRLEARVTHLEEALDERDKLLTAGRVRELELERALLAERDDKAKIRAAYVALSEQVAVDRERAKERENELLARLDAQADRIDALEIAIRERDRISAREIGRAVELAITRRQGDSQD